jgi:hypothetical protein
MQNPGQLPMQMTPGPDGPESPVWRTSSLITGLGFGSDKKLGRTPKRPPTRADCSVIGRSPAPWGLTGTFIGSRELVSKSKPHR